MVFEGPKGPTGGLLGMGLGSSWGLLGALGALLGVLGASWERLRSVFGPLGQAYEKDLENIFEK